MITYFTPADYLAHGLDLPLPDVTPVVVPAGTCCAITGQPITTGYAATDMVTGATAEFLDCFRGGVQGYVSVSAARCFKSADPRKGNPCARSVAAFDGWLANPLIARDQATAQGRPCWSDLVRELWMDRAGQQCLLILTTDTKKRLWIRARVGALGNRTPMLVYDADTSVNEVLILDWTGLLCCLADVESAYTFGFPKAAIRESLFIASKATAAVGLRRAVDMERRLAAWRGTPEMLVATLIAQKEPDVPVPTPMAVEPAKPVEELECLPLFIREP